MFGQEQIAAARRQPAGRRRPARWRRRTARPTSAPPSKSLARISMSCATVLLERLVGLGLAGEAIAVERPLHADARKDRSGADDWPDGHVGPHPIRSTTSRIAAPAARAASDVRAASLAANRSARSARSGGGWSCRGPRPPPEHRALRGRRRERGARPLSSSEGRLQASLDHAGNRGRWAALTGHVLQIANQ